MSDPNDRYTLLDRIALIWGTGFGTGYSPIVSGTVGTLVGIPLYFLFDRFIFNRPGLSFLPALAIYLGLTTLLFFFGVWAAFRMERWYAEKDPSVVVADEVVGYLVAACAIPLTPLSIVLTFVLFRIFDIIKPFPAGRSENLPGGWGIMVDDVWAGMYANVAARILLALIPLI